MTAEVTPKGYRRHPNGGGLVADTANVAPGAQIDGNARISGNARIDGYAEVLTSRHHMTHGPVGSEDRTVTLHRTVGGGHVVVAGCWEGTCDELAARIAKSKQAWPDVDKADRERWKADYEAMLVAFRVRANEWEVES